MRIRSFLKLVEIQTKAASMIPFLIGSVYVVFRFHTFDWLNFVLMFISLLTFDMFTTAMNNYYDYKKAAKTSGYGYEEHNAIVKYQLKEWVVVITIIGLFVTAVAAGVWLVFNTGLLLLLLGGLSFLVGILYSFGPIPISRMPLGEVFSGLFMGFVIIFISAFIHVSDGQLAMLTLEGGLVQIQFQLLEILLIFLISIPAILGIANIMLANNICDMEEDIANRRYTLPVYIGKKNALLLFRVIYYVSYLDLVILLALKVHPLVVLLVLTTFIPVRRKVKQFMKHQSKQHTFACAVQNFIITNAARVAALGLAVIMTL